MRLLLPPVEEKPLTLPQVAERLGVSRVQVWRLMQSGRLPADYERGRWWVQPRYLELFRQVPRPVGRPRRPTKAERMSHDRTPRCYGRRYAHLVPRDPIHDALKAAVWRGSWHTPWGMGAVVPVAPRAERPGVS